MFYINYLIIFSYKLLNIFLYVVVFEGVIVNIMYYVLVNNLDVIIIFILVICSFVLFEWKKIKIKIGDFLFFDF